MVENIIELIKECCKEISIDIREGDSILQGTELEHFNATGDSVKKLDIHSNNVLIEKLKTCKDVRSIASEEEDDIIYTENKNGRYLVSFDPLDGSSNIAVNITVGTIFCIFKYDEFGKILNGRNIVSAGYCLYGGSTELVIANKGEKLQVLQLVNNRTFKNIGDLEIPKKGNIYSFNDSNRDRWLGSKNTRLVELFLEKNYNARWVGSLVADAHRTLIKGGFFGYPADTKNKEGKIRLIYEAYPFAFIFEAANGYSSNGNSNILDISFPNNIHQRTPIYLMSADEYNLFINLKD